MAARPAPAVSRHDAPASGDRGFTLVEVLVALVLFSGAAFLMADVMLRAVRLVDRARRQAVMTIAAEQRLNQLLALDWGAGDAAAPQVSVDTASDLSAAAPTAGGPGLSLSPADTLATNRAGYVDFLDRSGRWVSAGPAPSPAAIFVRRWRVARGPAAATLLIDVQVEEVGRSSATPGASAPHVRLTGAKAQLAGWP